MPSHRPDGTVNFCLDHTNWTVPDAVDQVRSALDWVLDRRREIVVEAPRGVLAEYRAHDGRLFVHLVNMCDEPVRNVRIRMRPDVAASDVTATLETSDPDAGMDLETTVSGDDVEMIIAELDVYAVVVVQPFSADG